MSTQTETSSGIGFFRLLAIVFIVLKLTEYIDWSWWLVLLPIYGWIPIIILIGLVYLIFAVLFDK